jgi:hypothetical protein
MGGEIQTRKQDAAQTKIIWKDGKHYVVKVLPPADCSGETFPPRTAGLHGADFHRLIREARDEKTARRSW